MPHPLALQSEQGGLRHWEFEIGSKSVPGPLPGSKRTRFSRCVRPWRRGGPPKANCRCLKWASSELGLLDYLAGAGHHFQACMVGPVRPVALRAEAQGEIN